MNLLKILRGIFKGPSLDSNITEQDKKDMSELQWERALANARIRRARELQIDVDLERRE